MSSNNTKLDTNYTDVSARVLRHSKIREAINDAVQDDINDLKAASKEGNLLDENHVRLELQRKHKARTLEIVQRMRTCISSSLLRIAGWILYKVLGRMFTTIQYHKGQIEMIKKAADQRLPIIYLPVHRSHLDYVLISFILYMNNIKPPLVAAGDNLMIPFFGNLMRGLGAFFIKRKMDGKATRKDHVYRAVLQVYMAENLKQGHSLEFFLEGGRSRTGKTVTPKAGLLSVVVDSVLEGIVDDVFIVPIGISYEKLIDGNFITEQLGRSKVAESFSIAIKAIWRKFHSNFGSVRVDFCQPFYLRDYLKSALTTGNLKSFDIANSFRSKISCAACNHMASIPRLSSSSACFFSSSLSNNTSLCHNQIDNIVSTDYKRQVIYQLSEHVMFDSSYTTSLMSTQLVAFLLLNKYRKGASLPQLIQSMNWMRDELSRRKRSVGFSGDSCDALRYAFDRLGKDMVSTVTLQMAWSSKCGQSVNNNFKIVFIKPALKLPNVIELSYYSNACISAFLMDSIVANALFSVLGSQQYVISGLSNNTSVQRSELLARSNELCNIFKYDFLFVPPCKDINSVINETIDDMIKTGLLSRLRHRSRDQEGLQFETKSSRFEDSDDGYNEQSEAEEDEELEIKTKGDNCEALQLYRNILSPFIESYWLVCCNLTKILGRQIEDKVFLNEVIGSGKEKIGKGLVSLEESIQAETFKNAIKLFESWEVIESTIVEEKKYIFLSKKFDNKKSINELINHLERFKK